MKSSAYLACQFVLLMLFVIAPAWGQQSSPPSDGDAAHASPPLPAPVVIDASFAKKMLENQYGTAMERDFYKKTLQSLSKENLLALRNIIQDDLGSEEPQLIYPPYSSGLTWSAWGVVYEIDEIRGALQFDKIYCGNIKYYITSGAGVTWYTFQTDNRKRFEVLVTAATLCMPDESVENTKRRIRI